MRLVLMRRAQVIKQHLLMIALAREKPRLTKQLKSIIGLRTAINQISDRKHTITGMMEMNVIQGGTKSRITAMNIPHDKVAPRMVG